MIQICTVCGMVGNIGDADWKERSGNRYCPIHDEESFMEKEE